MRRREREAGALDPPPELLTYTGGAGGREKFAWLEARERWWAEAHGDDPRFDAIQWTIDGHDQVGDFAWCGLDGCEDPDCLCNCDPHREVSDG